MRGDRMVFNAICQTLRLTTYSVSAEKQSTWNCLIHTNCSQSVIRGSLPRRSVDTFL